ncbi:MAG: 50S ribosomal protein L29 [Candidatus Peregrinibacteria bacterium]
MKIESFSQLLALSIRDLEKKLDEARRELVKIRMGIAVGQQKDTSKYPKQRKLIAQLLTALHSKKLSVHSL